jgi:hypothetical protein
MFSPSSTVRRLSSAALLRLPPPVYISGRTSPARLRPRCQGHVAEWLRNGLQNRVRRFNSGRGLHSNNQWIIQLLAKEHLSGITFRGLSGDSSSPVAMAVE